MKILPHWSMRANLIALVVAAVVPLVLLSGALIQHSYQAQQAYIEDNLRTMVRATSASLDREFTSSIQALQVLGSSTALDRGNLAEFYGEMRSALATYGPAWQNITLSDAAGQQLINLRLPLGAPLLRLDPALIEENLRTRKPSISNLFSGPVTGAPSMVVSVLVFKDGQIQYLLRAGYSAARLSEVLAQSNPHPEWLMTILDRDQIIAARTRDIDKHLGKPASASFAAQARQHYETAWRGRTLEGVEVVSALRRSDLSGWTVGVAVPVASLEAPLRDSFALAAAVGFITLVATIGIAGLLGRRLQRDVEHLAVAAQKIAGDEIPDLKPLAIRELDYVAHEMQRGAERVHRARKALRRDDPHRRGALSHPRGDHAGRAGRAG